MYANPKVVPKYYAPRPASPVHRLRRCPAFGRAGCIIKNLNYTIYSYWKSSLYKGEVKKQVLFIHILLNFNLPYLVTFLEKKNSILNT